MTEPNNGHSTYADWTTQVLEESLANFRRMIRLPFLWQRAQRVRKGAMPSEVVYEEGKHRLLHYTGGDGAQYRTPLLVVFALVNRPYILDLKPGKSVVEHFVRRGFDTYLVDWGVPTDADKFLTLDDYVNGSMLNIVDFLRERCDVPQVNVLGYCMGGTMSAIFTALHQQFVRNLILLAAGIDFSGDDGLLLKWTKPQYFDVDALVDVCGNVPPQYLQSIFLLLKPIQNLFEKPIALWERMDDDQFVDDFLTMETWLQDNIPVPGEVFREFVKYLYQQNRLVKGQLPVGRHTVQLRTITCPVLNIMARKDDLVPCSQTLPFNDLVSSTDRKTMQLDAGHIGLAVGSKAQTELWPAAVDWLAQRSEAASAGSAPDPVSPASID
ncbi:MAG: class III poly(R)-hydroxyalkanoic acid synthase subunit PhaC [Tepidisphaeraceae bacterium]|jgi:polyhydroxyalkanoate synthase